MGLLVEQRKCDGLRTIRARRMANKGRTYISSLSYCVSLELPGDGAVSPRFWSTSHTETVSIAETSEAAHGPVAQLQDSYSLAWKSHLRFRRREFPGNNRVRKARSFVRPVAEWLVRGVATAAERDGGATG